MTTPPHGPMLLVANPRAGSGRGDPLGETRRTLDRLGIAHRLAVTTGPGDASDVARRSVVEEGVRHVVAIGGDGTVHEVVNGLVDAVTGLAVADDVVLAVVPGGSGCDFVRTWGLDLPVARLVERHVVTPATLPIDLGRVTCVDEDGRERTRVFANIAECGWGADVVRRANALPRFVGRARYLASIVTSTARLTQVETTVAVDHTSITEPLTEVVVANGQFFGSGMKIAPRALPDDGRFNVQTWRGDARALLENLPKARVGEHLNSADVREWQSAAVTVDAARPLGVEADGEVLGSTPARFDVLHHALRLSV